MCDEARRRAKEKMANARICSGFVVRVVRKDIPYIIHPSKDESRCKRIAHLYSQQYREKPHPRRRGRASHLLSRELLKMLQRLTVKKRPMHVYASDFTLHSDSMKFGL